MTVFWKRKALQEKIDQNLKLVKDHMFPTNADHFAMRVCHDFVDAERHPEMFKFIAYCFADFENPLVKEMGSRGNIF